MVNLTKDQIQQAKNLDINQNDAINNLNRFNYAYTPVPIAPFPSSMDEIKKYVTITPIGTYAPNDNGKNPIVDYMMQLPDKQTPETCIANAAMLKTRTLSKTPFINPQVVGTAKKMDKNVTSRQLIRNTEEIIKQVQKTESQTFYKNVSRTGTKSVTEKTKVYINGLHFRATRDGSGYMNDNPNYFNQSPDKIEIDTTKIDLYTDDLYLPTNFSNLENATMTNATPDKSAYTIYHNVECIYTPSRQCYGRSIPKPEKHFFAVEWSGFFKPNMTGQWVFTTDSDDVSFLWVESDDIRFDNGVFTPDNSTVDNRSLHGMQFKSSDDKNLTLNMTKDRYYRIKIQFSENGGGYNMIVTAKCKNGGNTITDFNGFFYAEVYKMVSKNVSYDYIEYNVPYQKDVLVTVPEKSTNIVYKEGDIQQKTISMGDMFNPTYSINDANAVYVSMVKDPTVDSSINAKYDCYVSDPTKVVDLNTTFNKGDDTTPIFNVINIWQSNSQGNVNDNNGYCNLNSTGSLLLDNVTFVQGLHDTTIQNIMSGNVADEIPYMYIAEDVDENVIKPSIIIVQKSKNMKKHIKISTDSTFKEIMKMCKENKIKQFSNKLWISETSNILAYNEKNENNKPEMGIIYKITNKVGLISNNKMFRLILINGKLTLQMCINPTKSLNNNPNLKYTEKVIAYGDNPSAPQNLTPNTMALLKIDTDHRINSVNLIDKAENKSYYVSDDYAAYNNKYSTYTDTFPSKERTDKGYVATSPNACEKDCNNSTSCRAFYSYKKGKTSMCSLVGGTSGSTDVNNFPDIANPQLFNPKSYYSDVTSSSLSIKNKTINPKYNDPTSIYKINNVSFNAGNSTIEKQRAYYPDQNYDEKNKNCTPDPDGKLSCDPSLDPFKELVRIRTLEKRNSLSVPTNINYLNILKDKYLIGMDKIVDTTIENYTNYREAYTPLSVKSGNTDYVSSKCTPGNNEYGLCDIADNLKKINTLQDNINTNSNLLKSNKGEIQSKISNVDSNFKTLSSNNSNNIYKYDFNGYDDNPDTSMLGAVERDTNVLLLYENNIYIIGTIITTSLAILGVILARS